MAKFTEGSRTSSEAKRDLRKKLRAERLSLPGEYLTQSNNGIFERLITLPEFESAKVVFTYLSVEGEPDTYRFARRALELGKTVAIPRVKGKTMDAVPVKSLNGLAPWKQGILQPGEDLPALDPSDIDFVVVPGLAFDKLGYRLGYGGGYYDRFLTQCRAYSVGLCRSSDTGYELPRDEWDVAVDCVLTELGLFCGKKQGVKSDARI